jgi:hypothetical protein
VSGEADGTTVDTITVNNATENALYTVTADLGTIEGTDASTAYAGFQVKATGTSFTFDVRRPTGVGSGTPQIRIEEVTGLKKGDLNQTYTLPAARRFDFNGSGNATQTVTPPTVSFQAVRGSTLYTADSGFGWTVAVSEFQRSSAAKTSVALYRDGHWGSAARTFDVAVNAGQEYSVRVYVGDASFARNNIQVRLEEGNWLTLDSTGANQFVSAVLTGSSSDGRLNISIRNNGGDPYWVFNGIDVWQGPADSSNDPGVANLLASVWSSEMVGHRLTEAALAAAIPAAREYWIATGLTDWQIAELYRTPIAIGDLSYRGALGVTKPEGIWLDASGAGLGWNVGSSQWSVVSGQWLGDISHQRTTANGQLPTAAYDLLTVLTHELGHVLGHDDLDPHDHPDHIMAGVLQPGAGRVEIAAGGRGPQWVAGAERDSGSGALFGPAAGGRGPLGGRGLLVDRVLDDLLRDDLRVSKDAWSRDQDDEFERLLHNQSGDRHEEIDDFFARIE